MRACRCGKTHTYRDEVAAKLALARLRWRDSPRRPRLECEAYQCRRGRWHLSSHPSRPRIVA